MSRKEKQKHVNN